MKRDDPNESKREPGPPPPSEGPKLTPPPKPRRDSLAAGGESTGSGPSIPSAPRVPAMPADGSAAARSASDAARSRERSHTPRARTSPSARPGVLRSEVPAERGRHPSFPLPPPAPVSLTNDALPLVSRTGRSSVPGAPREQSPVPAPGGPPERPRTHEPVAREPAAASNAPARPLTTPAHPTPTLEIAPPPPSPPQMEYSAPLPPTSPSFASSSPAPSASAANAAGPSAPSEPEKAGPSVAILAMRIIAVGAPAAAEPAEVEQDIEIHVDVPEPAPEPVKAAEAAVEEPLLLERLTPEPVELSDADVAPDSGGARAERAPAVEIGREEDTISIPPAEVDAETPVPEPAALTDLEQAKPPPPPRRKSVKPAAAGKSLPTAKKRQRRPWWEDVFGEEFVRAAPLPNEINVRREVDFIESSLGVAPGGVVLDLCCGAGHHAAELASRGYGLVGYDLSLYQLSLAAEVAQARGQKINFVQGDMREMAFEEMFDGVFSWNTSFGYFEEEKNCSVLERVFRALKPGGMFLIDVVNRDFAASQSPSQNWYEGEGCVCMDDMNLDYITSRLRVKRSVILDDGRTRECTYSIRVYSLHELGKLLHDVGFRVTEASGHPAIPGVFFGEHSPRLIVVAQKP